MLIDQLSSLLGEAAALEPWTLTDAQIRELHRTVHQARAALDALAISVVVAAEDRGMPREDGCTSTTAWLTATVGLDRGEAARLASLARLDGDVTETRAAWSAGLITTSQASVIARALSALPDWVGHEERHDVEQVMLHHVHDLTVQELRRLGDHIIEVIDPDGADEHIGAQLEAEERKAWDATRLHLTDDGRGITHLRGQVPAAQGGMLRTVLEAMTAPRRPVQLPDGSLATDPTGETAGPHGSAALGHPDHAHRLGWALCELIEHLPTDALPQAGGLPVTLTVEVQLNALRDALGTAGLSTGDHLSASQARRMACNANLLPIIMDGPSTILDLAPTRRLHDRCVTPASSTSSPAPPES